MNHANGVYELEASATRRTTQCGEGKLTWRIWGQGSPVILLHGSAGSWTHWVRNIGALAAGHTVYVPDLPGCGDSDPQPEPHTFERLAATLWSGLDELCPQHRSFALAGFSFGSVVAESMALARGAQVRELVLVRGAFNDTTPQMPRSMMKWKHLNDPIELAAAHRHNLSVLMFHDSAKIDAQAMALHAENSRRAVADLSAFFPSRATNALARIAAPVTGIAGQFDCFGLPDLAEQEQALLRARPDARFHLMPGAGHWVMYEAADTVNAILLQTLGQ